MKTFAIMPKKPSEPSDDKKTKAKWIRYYLQLAQWKKLLDHLGRKSTNTTTQFQWCDLHEIETFKEMITVTIPSSDDDGKMKLFKHAIKYKIPKVSGVESTFCLSAKCNNRGVVHVHQKLVDMEALLVDREKAAEAEGQVQAAASEVE
jgi:hypothetical protein